MTKRLGFIAITFLLSHLSPNGAFARQVYYGSELESVSVVYGGPTIFRFNEPVKTISQASRFTIGPADEESPNYAVLSVTPRFAEGKDKVTFILADGAVVNVSVITVSKAIPERTDSFYDFKPKETLLDSLDKDKGGPVLSELDLMKAMIRGDGVTGYKVESISRLVNTGITNISARLIRVYTGSKYNGYIFKIRNQDAKKKYTISLEKLTLGQPNTAMLSQIDRKVLGTTDKDNFAYLRIVAKPTSIYYNVSLPVAPIVQK
ncbi:MAG: hypothetical protein AB7T49_06665 [Oligoflexales bacterium]